MEGWSGFTDDELRKLKKAPSRLDYSYVQDGAKRPVASRGIAGSGRPMGRAGIRPSGPIQGRPPKKELSGPVSSDMILSQPKMQPQTPMAAKEQSPQTNESPKSAEPVNQTSQETSGKESSEKVKDVKEVKEVSEKTFLQKQLSKVESYQLQQKVMEEQNRLKKKLLAEAIAEKQKRAKVEANKLVHIQKELATLDQMLSSDVAIIRNHIEEASREFLEAQKRYETAEKEFVEAKIALHHANEQKEQLTEHLYTIIHQNEMRKAKKLTELMEKLELAEDIDVTEVQVELTTLMPNLVPEMSTISSFELLNRKKSHPGAPVSLPCDTPEQQLNGASAVANDRGTVHVNLTETADSISVEKPSQGQEEKASMSTGTDASGQVTQNDEALSHEKDSESTESPNKSSTLEKNSNSMSHKDQNDNVKNLENVT